MPITLKYVSIPLTEGIITVQLYINKAAFYYFFNLLILKASASLKLSGQKHKLSS